jgi:hypothetical protein
MGFFRGFLCRPCFNNPDQKTSSVHTTIYLPLEGSANLPTASFAPQRPELPGKWREGDNIEYLVKDVVKGEKSVQWVPAKVVAVRSRIVRDVERREFRLTYTNSNKHQETTYWMPHSDLRLRVPRRY